MTDLITLMSAHHQRCDDAFARAEQAAEARDWARCEALAETFVRDTLAHFDAEEQILFPAFERATGMSMGPTRMMRLEHEQLRALFEHLCEASRARDRDTFRGAAETLLVMMEQHNLKEENILYPMCAQHLHADTALIERLQARLAA